MIGLELGVSGGFRGAEQEPTGVPVCFNSDVVATAKRGLKKGEVLDGEGGFSVWGKQATRRCVARGGLSAARPLRHNVALKRDIAEGEAIKWAMFAYDAGADAVKVRREMEVMFARPNVR